MKDRKATGLQERDSSAASATCSSTGKPKGVPTSLPTSDRLVLSRQFAFKRSEPWVSAGSSTQMATAGAGAPIDVVIGLDFGTSYTKAAVRLKDQLFVVTWEGISKWPEPYLLPSEFSVIEEGICHVGQAPSVSATQVRQRLKHPFFDPAVSSASIGTAAAFLALLLRYIRAWTFRFHGSKIGSSHVRWLLNIGAPSNGLEHDKLKAAYRRLGRAAWGLSVTDTPIRLDDARDCVSTNRFKSVPFHDLISLEVVPEFVAQIAGYVQSPRRRPGLHGLIDVGGGTMDVVTFIVHDREGENVFPFLVPEVSTLGTQMLYWNRLVDVPAPHGLSLPDDLKPVLDAPAYATVTGLPLFEVLVRDKLMWNAVSGLIHIVLNKTKQKRYRLAPEWSKGLPLFLTGGGGQIDGYKAAVMAGCKNCAPNVNLMALPVHPRLAGFSGSIAEFQRVSVACGLAQDPFSLGELVPAGKVEDDVPVHRPIRERLDRDELYAR